MFLGDMNLIIEKLVSLDGENFWNASSQDLAVVIPENQSTRLYNKLLITNPNDVSVQRIKLDHFFDIGESDMTAGDIENLQGTVLNKLDAQGNLRIEKITTGETVEITYSILIHENGQNVNPAFDGLEILDYQSNLQTIHNLYLCRPHSCC